MTRLVLDATHSVTRIEVMDWLQYHGITTYDVTPMPDGVTQNGQCNKYGFTTDDLSAHRALFTLRGQTIGRTVITFRLDNPD